MSKKNKNNGQEKNKEEKDKKQTQKEFDELRNQLARALADYDNLRKRVEKEKKHFEIRATARIVSNILPIYDMLVDAQESVNDSGIAMIINEFESILKDSGIEKIKVEKGDKFDENVHEVTETVEDEEKEKGEVVEISTTGWKMKDGPVIRYAKVKVAK